MFCKDYERYGIGYLYGELSQGEKGYMDEHIKLCTACAEEVSRDREIQDLFSALPLNKAPVLPLRNQSSSVSRRPLPGVPGKGRLGLALAASLLMFFLGFTSISRIDEKLPPQGGNAQGHPPGGAGRSALSWKSADEKGIETIQCTIDDMKNPGMTYYDIARLVGRRDRSETVVVLRGLESYNDEIKMLDRTSIGF
jgi:hypothetical protein